MGIFARRDSPYWWLYLETTHQKERTDIPVGTTPDHRRDSRRLAEDRYHQRMNEIAARLYKLPSARAEIRFAKYAEAYRTETIAARRGADRELTALNHLVADLGDELLSRIDTDRTKLYTARRLAQVSARTVNREVDVLKGMLRDAVPKYLNASPIAGLRQLRVVKPKRRFTTEAEFEKLIKAGDLIDRALLLVARTGLIRLSDVLELGPADRDGRWLHVRAPKNDIAYDVALSVRAAAALDALPTDHRYYFEKFRRAVKRQNWRNAVRHRLQSLCRAAKIRYGRAAGGVTFHWATRRSGAIELLVKRGVPLPVVQAQGGWAKPNVLLEIYAEADRHDQLKAVRAFPRRSRPKRKRA